MAWYNTLWEVAKTLPISASVGPRGTRATPMSIAQVEEALPGTQRRRTGELAATMEDYGLVPAGTRDRVTRGEVDFPGLQALQAIYQQAPVGRTQPAILSTLFPAQRTPSPTQMAGSRGFQVAASPGLIATPEGQPVSPPPDRNEYVRNLVGLLPTSALPTVIGAEYARMRPAAARPLSPYEAGQLLTNQQRTAETIRHNQAMEQATKDRNTQLAQPKPPTLNARQLGLLSQFRPGKAYKDLTDPEKAEFGQILQADEDAQFTGRQQAMEARKARENQAKLEQEHRAAAGALTSLKTLVADVFTLPSPSAHAGKWGKLRAMWDLSAEKWRLNAESMLQPEGSLVRQYNDAAQSYALIITRALTRSGQMSDRDVARAAALLPTLGERWWQTPDTKETALAKMAQLETLINEARGRAPGTFASGYVTGTAKDPASWRVDYSPRGSGGTVTVDTQLDADESLLEEYAPSGSP
jgi:hypothetical protein